MKIEHSAGQFKGEAYTDGSPVWTTIEYDGANHRVRLRMHPSKLADLEYVVRRMRKAIEAHAGKKATA